MEAKRVRFHKTYLFPMLLGGILQALPVVALGNTVLTTVCALLWPFFLLLATRRTDTKRRFLLCMGVLAVSMFLRFMFMFGTEPLYMLCVLALCTFMGILYLPAFLLDKLVTRRESPAASLVFPVLFTAGNALSMVLGLGNLTDPAAAFANIPVLAQCASLITEYGLCFFFSWILSMLALALDAEGSRRIVNFSVPILLSVALLIFGLTRLSVRKDPSGSIRVAMCTTFKDDFSATSTTRTPDDYYSLIEREIEEAVGQGAELVLFVEEHDCIPESAVEPWMEKVSALIRQKGVPVLLSLEIMRDGEKSINRSVLLDKEGNAVFDYVKHNLVPVVETSYYEKGSGDIPVAALAVGEREYTVAPAICYDINNPAFLAGMDPDTELLLVPSWEWDYNNREQGRSVILRALENGVTIIKATQDGFHTVSDPYGRIVFKESSAESYEAVTVTDVPLYEKSAAAAAFALPVEYSTASGELTSAVMLLILLVSMCFQAPGADKKARIYIVCLVLTILGLLMDAFSYIFDGSRWSDGTAFFVNLCSYLFVDFIMIVFALYFRALLQERKGRGGRIIFLTLLLPVLDTLFLLISGITGRLFTISDGLFVPGIWDSFSGVGPALSILTVLFMAVLNRKCLNMREYSAFVLYMVLPLAAGLLTMVFGGVDSLSYIAVALSMLILFVLIQSNSLDQSRIREEVLLEVSMIDQLTSLGNRRAADKRLSEYAGEDPFAVVFCDLNSLKEANDTLGHAAGDALLIRFAELLKEHFKAEDIFRISGDEFVVLPRRTSPERFRADAERFKAAAEANDNIAAVGWAYGVGETGKDTINLAEENMYKDKHAYHLRTGKTER